VIGDNLFSLMPPIWSKVHSENQVHPLLNNDQKPYAVYCKDAGPVK